eukprot:566197-Pelagomonas_calceolata.AAC.1
MCNAAPNQPCIFTGAFLMLMNNMGVAAAHEQHGVFAAHEQHGSFCCSCTTREFLLLMNNTGVFAAHEHG